MWTIYKLRKTNEHTILKLWTLIKNIIERTHKFPYNILFTFLMDRGRAPNGIGHLMILNNMLKIHDNIPHIKGVIVTRVKHKCTGKLEVFITAGGGHWRCSRLSPVCPRAPIKSKHTHTHKRCKWLCPRLVILEAPTILRCVTLFQAIVRKIWLIWLPEKF